MAKKTRRKPVGSTNQDATRQTYDGGFISSGLLYSFIAIYSFLGSLYLLTTNDSVKKMFENTFRVDVPKLDINWFRILLVLSTPHTFYALTWTQPATFSRIVRSLKLGRPIDVFAHGVHLIKLLQFTVLAYYYYTKLIEYGEFPTFHPIRSTIGIVCLLFGQYLNYSIYAAIGFNGVYYGCRLLPEEPVPWCSGFPFNTVSHPQYVGAALSVMGGIFLAVTPKLQIEFYSLAIVWASYYVTSAKIEEKY
eukprot:g1529.t1